MSPNLQSATLLYQVFFFFRQTTMGGLNKWLKDAIKIYITLLNLWNKAGVTSIEMFFQDKWSKQFEKMVSSPYKAIYTCITECADSLVATKQDWDKNNTIKGLLGAKVEYSTVLSFGIYLRLDLVYLS